MNNIEIKNKTASVILAGGTGKRMGGMDKGLINFNQKPIFEHLVNQLTPQCHLVIINANRNINQYSSTGNMVITDIKSGFQGPLAGIHAALASIKCDWLVTVPCDGPHLCEDYVLRFFNNMTVNTEIAVATFNGRIQPVHACISRRLLNSLEKFLENGDRKIDSWYAKHRCALVNFDDEKEVFTNFNTMADIENYQTKKNNTIK